ncbi:DUF4489 domain-containing protein [Irregularibacter muris]|uniref:DUF4489 domain-containing protein n=1 Tax=Irregularibacter muris TaxID=1796619 RepID=A0AAE3HCU6_9FIRM|nr:DUF4489 domain-containing protein [Irregularibacter muris]MCR1897940.1 DUF4489 domain-containing protein [Irregularibacter muris]
MTVYYQPGYQTDNKKNDEKCFSRCHRQDDCCRKVDCSPDKVVFKCNNISGASGISVIAIGDTVMPRNVATVSVPDLCCFKRPCTKIDFSAIITFSAAIAVGTTITFRVFKRCGSGDEIQIQSFDFTQGLALAVGSSIPVSFSICDCDGCFDDDCCVYRVAVEATATVALATAINVNQGTISAFAADLC